MKKFKSLFLVAVMLPIMILSGCTGGSKYTLQTFCNNAELGSVSGGSIKPIASGANVRITAEEISGGKFLCWVKDYRTVISTNKQENIKLSEKTAGNYIAIFEDTQDIKNMDFACVSGLSYIPTDDIQPTRIIYSIRFAPTDNAEQWTTIVNYDYTVDGEESSQYTFNNNVFRLHENSGPTPRSYIFDATIEVYYNSNDSLMSRTYTIKNESGDFIVGNSNFTAAQSETIELSKQGLTITLSKLNHTLFPEDEEEQN